MMKEADKDIVRQCEKLLGDIKSGSSAARKKMSEMFPKLQRTADSGRVDAQALVGGLALEYIDNVSAASYYFRLAADAGNPAGQRGLGHMMFNGIGMDKDLAGAAKLFEAAAKSGDPIAAFNLGSMLLKGAGVAQDETRAVELLKKASSAGIPAAAALLADWYAGRQDYEKARSLYAEAADGGIKSAMFVLGKWYSQGIGGEIDKVEAVRWLLKPIEFGEGGGVHNAIRIARTMTEDEIREAAMRAGRMADAAALINTIRNFQN